MLARQTSDEGKKEAKRYWERAKYYEQQGDSVQALSNYVESLVSHAKYIYWEEASWEGERIRAGRLSVPSWDIKDEISFIMDLSNRLIAITEHYKDPVKEAFLLEKQRLIFEALSNHQNQFEVEDIKVYNDLGTLVKYTREKITCYQKDIDEIKKVKPENESDRMFKKIREALQKISSTKICLVELESTSSSGCFIATAAYSTSTHPDLDTFRNFRDEKLLTNAVGKQLVKLYYRISPSIAQYVEKQPAIKSFVRYQLERLAKWMRSQRITNK